MEVYKPKYFKLYELVPRVVYENTAHHKIWYCWRPEILWTADQLRDLYGPATINDWYWGGYLQYRGWRPQAPPPGQKWAEWTQHAWWNALDMNFENASAAEIRADIKANKWPVAFQHIRCIEDDVNWLHIDSRNVKDLLIVTP